MTASNGKDGSQTMVNRNSFRGLRTPRKTKVWATKRGLPPAGVGVIQTGVQVFFDFLSDYRSDMGISNTDRVTHMRTVGDLYLMDFGGGSAAITTAVSWGIAWLTGPVASAAVGDAQIPDPAEQGVNESQWLQRGTLIGSSPGAQAAIVPASGPGMEEWHERLDVTMMRKQPTADSKLCLVLNVQNDNGDQFGLAYQTHTLIALS